MSHVILFDFFNTLVPQAQIIKAVKKKKKKKKLFAGKNILAYMIYLPFLLAPNIISKVFMGVAILSSLQVLGF